MSLILIRRTYDDGQYPNSGIIGAIKTDLDGDCIESLWNHWRNEVPEPYADSQFIDWLKKKGYQIEDVSFEIADV